MSTEIRAQRAADGLRASSQGVDTVAQLTQLKTTHRNRNMGTAIAAAVLFVAVIAGGFFFAGRESANPAPPAGPSPTAVAGPGAGLDVPVSATAIPAGYRIGRDNTAAVDIVGPPRVVPADEVTYPGESIGQAVISIGVPGEVVDTEPTQNGFYGLMDAPADLTSWIRTNKFVVVKSERAVTVDGRPGTQFVLTQSAVARTAFPGSSGSVSLATGGNNFRVALHQGYAVVTVIPVDSIPLVVVANTYGTPTDQLQADLNTVLDGLKIP
jgi:hypothetical protein